MSKVAKNPIHVNKVVVTIENDHIHVKGTKGELKRAISNAVNVKFEENVLYFSPKNDLASANALAGTTRAIVNNMIQGVTQGFTKDLQLVGVGYKAQAKGNCLTLNLGYSHLIDYPIPEGITIETPSATEISVKGIDKELVGQVCADIIGFRPPEPYKGKGVRYKGQVIILKEAKKK